MQRTYLPTAETLYGKWRFWQNFWRWNNILIGGASVGLGVLVAANTKSGFLPDTWGIVTAVAAPILTFLLTSLKPQGEAAAFCTAARELEKALHVYQADPQKDDTFLSEAIVRGVEILNKVGSA